MKKIESEYPYLKTTCSAQKIHDSQLNVSPTKMLYSFPHANRFENKVTKSTLHVPFYNILGVDPHKNLRACSLGKGVKYDFTKNSKGTPAPNSYHPKTQSICPDGKRGYTFGVSRESSSQNGILPSYKFGLLKPGPGAYTPQPLKTGVTVTFKIKTGKHNNENVKVGPGAYEYCTTFQPSKQIFNSKFKSTKGVKFPPLNNTLINRPDSSEKQNLTKSQSQIGLQCDLTHQMNKNGVFFNSKYHNSLCRSFGKNDRDKHLKKLETPGPGSYLMPSEFGFYASSKFS